MLHTRKKLVVFFLLLFVVLNIVFAATYKIVDYDFNITGSTKKWALSNRVKGSDEVFTSVEDLEKALENKRQTLWNTNVFTAVKWSWEELETVGDTVNVKAVFDVVDSGSYILLPYPKYDSNTGFSLGLRYKNNNVLGTMGTAAASIDWVQNGSGLDSSYFEFEIPFNDILLSNGSSLFFDITGSYNMADPDDGKVEFSTGINDFVISDVTLNGSVGIAYVYDGNTFDYFNSSLSASGFKIGSAFLDAAFSAKINYNSDIDDSYVTTTLSLREIDLGKVSISDTLTYKLTPRSSTDVKTLSSYEISNATSVAIESDVLINPVAGATVGVNFPDNYQYLTLSFSFEPIEKITSTSSVTGYYSPHYDFYKLTASQGFSTSFKLLDEKLTVSPSVSIINKNSEDYDLLPRAWELDSALTVSGGSINRVTSGETFIAFRDNFRKGIKTEAQGLVLWNIDEEPDLIARAGVTGFVNIFNNFNPSFRLYVAASADQIDWFNQADGNTYANADLYSFFDYTMTKETLNTLIRGVRLDSEKVQNSHKTNYMGYFTMNLTSSFLYFEDFGHLYVSPFLDAAVFSNDFSKDYDLVSGVGVEAYLIMDSHASYPIRASLGFDLEDLIDKFSGKDTSLSYEIYIGLGFVY